MPRGDGTGPRGKGARTGRGMGGAGMRSKGGRGSGPGGNCVCPSCGETAPHEMGTPCNTMKCPNCGAVMTRE